MENVYTEPRGAGQRDQGSIEVICGPMFSGKTEELLRRLRRARIAGLPLAIFKPEADNRYALDRIVSHDTNYFPSMPLPHSSNILKHKGDARLIAIDEVQFFDDEVADVMEKLAESGVRVIAAGLNMDYLGKPFGPMPRIMAIADYVTKLNAICVICGRDATHTYRKIPTDELVAPGGTEAYDARCRACFKL